MERLKMTKLEKKEMGETIPLMWEHHKFINVSKRFHVSKNEWTSKLNGRKRCSRSCARVSLPCAFIKAQPMYHASRTLWTSELNQFCAFQVYLQAVFMPGELRASRFSHLYFQHNTLSSSVHFSMQINTAEGEVVLEQRLNSPHKWKERRENL